MRTTSPPSRSCSRWAKCSFALANRGGDHSRTAEALEKLGLNAYRFWKGEPDASVEATFDAAQTWGAELNKLLTANNVPLSLRIIMPRATFDMGTMLSEQSLTGSTSRVHEPLSWTVDQQLGRQPQSPGDRQSHHRISHGTKTDAH